jgi:hypothetical protein
MTVLVFIIRVSGGRVSARPRDMKPTGYWCGISNRVLTLQSNESSQ